MGSRIVAVIDWRSASLLKDNARLLERAGISGKARKPGGRGGTAAIRSLTLREDGSCEVQRFTTVTAARRLGGAIARRTGRNTGNAQGD